MYKFVISLLMMSIISLNLIALTSGEGGYLFRVPIPHQLGNLIDLIAPIHIRFATDGVKHHPVVRFPILDLISRGQIFNKPGIHHLVHGPGIPW